MWDSFLDLSKLRQEGWFLSPGESEEDLLDRRKIFFEADPSTSPLLQKAGEVDSDRTARAILTDWQDGKIKI